MKNFKRNQKGYTLAEMALTAAMVGILGSAAATATTDTAGDARQVVLDSIAEVLSKASQMNQNDMNDDNTSGSNVWKCVQIGPLVEGGILPEIFAFTETNGNQEIISGKTVTCTISTTTTPIQHAEFIAFGVNNGISLDGYDATKGVDPDA
jgi:type II secretory pathway pseudopilin PulG